MHLVTAIIRPERLEAVKEALETAQIHGMTLLNAAGQGDTAPYPAVPLRTMVQVAVAVPDGSVDPAISAIVAAARTGVQDDGRILVTPLERVVRIRPGEPGALAAVPETLRSSRVLTGALAGC
jgi:nitrogen regulatory protein P-II 1